MKKELPTVHCVYAEVEESLETLIQSSFRLYLARMLSMQETLGESIQMKISPAPVLSAVTALTK